MNGQGSSSSSSSQAPAAGRAVAPPATAGASAWYGGGDGVQHAEDDLKAKLCMLPVSAVAAGKAPDRSGTMPTGADIMIDALMEHKVAMQAKRFMEGAASAGGSASSSDRSP